MIIVLNQTFTYYYIFHRKLSDSTHNSQNNNFFVKSYSIYIFKTTDYGFNFNTKIIKSVINNYKLNIAE